MKSWYWKEDEINLLKQLYPKTRKEDLLSAFPGRSLGGILTKGKSLGLKRDTFKKPIMWFDTVTTEAQAYMLGYLAADGHINRTGNKYSVIFRCAEQDCAYLSMLHSLICPDATFTKRYYEDPRGLNVQPYCRFDINNKVLVKQLETWDTGPRKSLTLKFPKLLSEDFYWHWFRGFFDGDGTVQIQKKDNLPQCGYVGTYDVLNVIHRTFNNYYPNRTKIYKYDYQKYFKIMYGGLTAAVFLDKLYEGAIIYMERKYKKAQPFIGDNLVLTSKKLNRELWYREDVDLLLTAIDKYKGKKLYKFLGKSPNSVEYKIRALGLRK